MKRKKELIIKRLGKKHGYVIEVKGYIFETLEEDLESLADDIAYKDELEVEEELNDLKKFYRKRNGIILKTQVYLREFRYEFSTDKDLKGLLITMKYRRSILRMLRETYSI